MTATDGIRMHVLHVDGDAGDRETLSEVVAEEQDVAVTGAATVGEAASTAHETEFDCVVTAAQIPGGTPEELLTRVVTPRAVPHVLFVDSEETDPPAALLESAVSIVEKGGARNCQFLLEKCRSATGIGRPDDIDIAWERDRPDTVATTEDLLAVLVADDEILWTNQTPAAVIPGAPTTATASDFHEVLAGQFTNGERFGATLAEATETDVEGLVCELPAEETDRYYVCWTESIGDELPADRVELYRDVTDRLARNDRLRRARTLVENARDGIYSLNANAEITYANDAFLEMFGYTPAERDTFVGNDATDGIVDEDVGKGQKVIQELIENPEKETARVDLRQTTKDDDLITTAISFTLTPFDDGSYTGLMGVARDVTERRERERELERYRTLVETSTDPMYVLDGDGNIELSNTAMAELVGEDRDSLAGSPLAAVLSETWASKQRDARSQLTMGRQAETVSFEVPLVDDQRYFAVNTTLIDHDDPAAGSVSVLREVTKEKERRRELKERERRLRKQNEHLERFGSMISHDLRNPLGLARLNLDFARDSGDEEDIEAVADALERIDQMIDELLTFARLGGELPETEATDIADTVKSAWSNVPAGESTLELAPTEDWTVEGNKQNLLQVFENLFANAVDHNEDPVTITVGIDQGPSGRCLYVEDDGSGIPDDEKDDVFSHGFTSGEGSTGFGLTIVAEVLDAHGWEIRPADAADGGARFEITGLDDPGRPE